MVAAFRTDAKLLAISDTMPSRPEDVPAGLELQPGDASVCRGPHGVHPLDGNTSLAANTGAGRNHLIAVEGPIDGMHANFR